MGSTIEVSMIACIVIEFSTAFVDGGESQRVSQREIGDFEDKMVI